MARGLVDSALGLVDSTQCLVVDNTWGLGPEITSGITLLFHPNEFESSTKLN